MDSVAWLAEEPELLHAALELIDSWDDVESLPLDSSDASTTLTDSGGEGDHQEHSRLPPLHVKQLPPSMSKPSSSRRVKASTVTSTHHRRRKEIFFLRDKVEELEGQLSTLQLEKKKRKLDEPGEDQPLAVMWRQIAEQQLRLRQEAEVNQAKLRNLLETQAQVARGLMMLLDKARQIENDEVFEAVKRPRTGPRLRFPLLQEEDLIQRIDLIHANLEELFTFHKFHDGTPKFVDVAVSGHEADEIFIDIRDAWTVPFPEDLVLEALWEYTMKEENAAWRPPQSQQHDRLNDDGRVLVSQYRVRSTVGDLTCDYSGQLVSKRFSFSTPAIISSMYSRPTVTSGVNDSGTYSQASSCFRVVGVPNQPGVSRIESSMRFSLQFDQDVGSQWRNHVGFLTNMILGKLSNDIEKKHDAVVTLLLHSPK